MGFWGKREDERRDNRESPNDEQAIERYRYMLRTAPPETIQQAHEEAFARLTPDQRRTVLQELTESIPPEESRRATDDPASLARLATRTEIRQPGMLERVFGSSRIGGGAGGMGMGLGGMFAGSLLASIAGTFIASSIAHSFFDQHPFDGDTTGGANEFASSDYGSENLNDTADPGLGDFDGGFDGGDIDI